MKQNTIEELKKFGAIHLTQVLPQRLLRKLRSQIREFLPHPSKNLGIDRRAVAFHQNFPGQLRGLEKVFFELPSLYEIGLHPQIGQLLSLYKGWSKASMSPIFNIRSKLPWHINQSPFTNVPWHQDYGASDPSSGEIDLVTAWIPLTAATSHHGGLELIPGSNQLGWLPHHRGRYGPEVVQETMKEAMLTNSQLKPFCLEAMPGDLVLLDQLTLHRSLPNLSTRCRWTLDFRYAEAGCNTGRPGLWTQDPIIGDPLSPEVLKNVQQRQTSLTTNEVIINKRVDLQ